MSAPGVNVKVAYATHEPPFSPCGRRAGGSERTVMTFIIRGISTDMIVRDTIVPYPDRLETWLADIETPRSGGVGYCLQSRVTLG